MHCPDDLELTRWVDGALAGRQAQELADHFAVCLECRLAAGAGAGAGHGAGAESGSARSSPDPSGTDLRLPTFEEMLPALRRAYAAEQGDTGRRREPVIAEADTFDASLLMAADSDLRSRTATIPSFLGEEGRLVVTFRVDPETGTATAHFVSRDPVRIRFRALQVGDEVRLSDSSGKVDLAGFTPDELIGMRISVPPSHCGGEFEPASHTGGVDRTEIPLLDPAGRPVAFRAEVRISSGPAGGVISLVLRGAKPPSLGVILIGDGARARFVRLDESNTAVFAWGSELPKQVRATIIDLA